MRRIFASGAVMTSIVLGLGGCGFSPYDLPLPGGADLGSDPYIVKIQFRDALDLVPQSAVRVDDIAVGKVTKIALKHWSALVTVKINGDVELPANADATIRQSSLLGEKFVELAAPAAGASGQLQDGAFIPLERSGRNPEIEEVLGAASLLLNGGGLDKANTIVRELNKTLDGNEPEVRELLANSEQLIGQLDHNKEALLNALEKVDNLAVTANSNKRQVAKALRDLPAAMRVVNHQRDDLVTLLQSLDRLGDVATDVIRRSKTDTLRTLRYLGPTLKGLADAGDSLATASEVLLSFPFTDAAVGGSVARAEVSCSANAQKNKDGACYGDFANLSLRIALDAETATNLIAGVLSLAGALPEMLGDMAPEGMPELPELPELSLPQLPQNLPQAPGSSERSTPEPPAAVDDLIDLINGLVPGGKTDQDHRTPSSPTTTAAPATPSPPRQGIQVPILCSLLGSCRVPAASYAESQKSDFGRLIMGPVVSR